LQKIPITEIIKLYRRELAKLGLMPDITEKL